MRRREIRCKMSDSNGSTDNIWHRFFKPALSCKHKSLSNAKSIHLKPLRRQPLGCARMPGSIDGSSLGGRDGERNENTSSAILPGRNKYKSSNPRRYRCSEEKLPATHTHTGTHKIPVAKLIACSKTQALCSLGEVQFSGSIFLCADWT